MAAESPAQGTAPDAADATASSPPAEEHYAVAALNSSLPGALIAVKDALGEISLTVERDSIREVCAALKAAGYNFMEDVTCVDWYPAEPRFHVVYHLLSLGRKERVRVKVLASDGEAVNSIVPVWPSANFYEREVFDLFGIRFGEHPNLRRILMPDDWNGNPLRKDYPVEGYR